jgi:hypothetical protein
MQMALAARPLRGQPPSDSERTGLEPPALRISHGGVRMRFPRFLPKTTNRRCRFGLLSWRKRYQQYFAYENGDIVWWLPAGLPIGGFAC